jgi:LPXTG-site transpeptidase (sortase) family protein
MVWLGWILTTVAIAVTASLSIAAFGAEASSAMSETNIAKLAAAKQIDQTARAKYLTAQAEKKAAAEEAARLAAKAQITQTIRQTNSTTRPVVKQSATPKPTSATPTCDRLIIPKIGLNACLATVGLTSNGAIGVHASLPAWFNQSSRAGTRSGRYSATFIDGHRGGIFRNLGQLAVGDTVTVTLMSGEVYTYTVQATETMSYAQVDMRKALSIYGGAGQGLNLMTCHGAYNSNIDTAEARLTVYATR